ncbi:MBG domain-containing protein [Rhizobium sp. LEGMi135b]
MTPQTNRRMFSNGVLSHRARTHKVRLVALLASTALVHATVAPAQSLPTGGQVAAGSATIGAPSAGALTINQTSGSAVVNWQSFNVGKANRVTFVQPDANAAILNRVTGETSSTIAGQITANGQVYLINPNGIAITSSGTVNTGAFVASTLGISDDDFMSGQRNFTGNGASAPVTNAGSITINRGGYMALIGGTVANAGVITVPMGKAALGSGEQATLDLSGDGFLQVAVPTKAGGSDALVSNSGRISTRGGTVQLSAAAAKDMARQAVNMSGMIEAKGVSGRSGDIVLSGDDGEVAITGGIDASSKRATGGTVQVTGRKITLANAKINASGKTGGGTVTIGGGRQGKGTLQHAQTLDVDANTLINADAITTGNGGNVVLWSDDLTRFAGTITAKGGALSGNGGEVEVSGKAKLAYTGLTDLTAAYGSTGNLLLDPYNVTISTGADSNSSGFTASGNDSIINVTTLTNALATANVTVSTGGAGSAGSQAGDITIAAPLAWSANLLQLNAAHSINIDATVTVGGTGALMLNTNVGWGASGTVDFGLTATGFAGRIDFTGTPGSQALFLNGAQQTLVYSAADLLNVSTANSGRFALASNLDLAAIPFTDALIPTFSGSFDGLGHTISNLTINSTTNNAAVGLFGTVTGGTIRNIGLVGGTVSGVGTAPQYPNPVAADGALVGLLTTASNGTQASVINAFASTNVSGGTSANVGGLVGGTLSNGAPVTIANSYATGAVVAGSQGSAGGLVGQNYAKAGSATITGSYATGTVTTGSLGSAGGLVGYNYANSDTAAITGSHATGTVTGDANATLGGLVGQNFAYINMTASIASSYATGTVGSTAALMAAGGLVGLNSASTGSSALIDNAFATGAVYGGSMVGGLVGQNYAFTSANASITNAYATGAVSGVQYGQAGGLVGMLQAYGGTASISNVYATGSVTAPTQYFQTYAGGLIGWTYPQNGGTISVSNAYWDTSTSGIAGNGIGNDGAGQQGNVSGLATSALQTAGINLGSAFAGGTNGLYPYLTSIFQNGVQAITGTAYLDNQVTPAASGSNGAVTVTGLANGSRFGSASTGANGYYYIFGAAGAFAPGNALVTYTSANPGTGATNSAAFAAASSQPVQTGFNLLGNTLSGSTVSTLYSTAGITKDAALAASGNDAGAIAAINGTSSLRINALGASFTIDQAMTIDALTVATANGSPLTVASPLTLTAGSSLRLLSGGALTINAPITVKGAGSVALGYDSSSASNLSFGLSGSGFTGNLTYLNADGTPATSNQGGSLTVNGAVYSLLYSMADVANITSVGLAGQYALANSLDAAGTTYNDALIGPNSINYFTGAFEGLGHTISNLTISKSADGAGLFGYSSGLIQDIGLLNVSVANTNPFARYVGGLVGYQSGNTINNAYVSGSVNAGSNTGGLVGYLSGGTINSAYSSATVSGATSVGGLAGFVNGGAVNNAYATGAVVGTGNSTGGLIGGTDSSSRGVSIANVYATGAVIGGNNVGGLIGFLYGTLGNAYSTGAVSGGTAGGLVGYAYGGSIANTYWDTQTSGTTTGIANDSAGASGNVTGLTTAQLQDGSSSAGLGSSFTVSPGLYAYLTPFYANGVQAISGIAYQNGGTTALASGGSGAGLVNVRVGNGAVQTVTTGANGYYYAIVANGTIDTTNGTDVLAYTIANATTGAADGATFSMALGTVNNVDVSGGWRRDTTALGTLSTLDAAYANATAGTTASGLTFANRSIFAVNDFAIDTALSVSGTVNLSSPGNVTQTAAISANTLMLQGAGNTFTLTNSGNQFSQFAASGGAIDIYDASSLTVAANVTDACNCVVTGVTGDQIKITTAGDLTIASGAAITGSSPVLAASGAFINNAGSGAVAATSGRWLIYSANPTGDTFGGLDSGNTAVWNTVAGDAVSATGNRYVFDYHPTLTVAAVDASKTYGDVATLPNASITGLDAGVTGAYLGDTLSDVVSGSASVTSTGVASSANVGTFDIVAAQGSLVSSSYGFNFVNGSLSVTPRALTVTADAQTRIYGNANPVLTYTIGGLGLVNNDTLSGSLSTSAGQYSNVGAYAIAQGTLAASSNYALTYAGANLTVNPRALTVTADGVSKTYGDVNPALTYTATGLINNDTLSGSLATTAGQYSNVGSYGITQGSLANANYAISYTGANLTVNSRALTVMADAKSKAYGDANPALTYTTSGLVNNDTLSGSLATTAGQYSNVGAYAITQGSLANANYAISYTGANLTVNPRALTVTADGVSKTYGDANPTLTYAASGLVNNDTLFGSLSTSAGQYSNVGAYAITQGSLANSNYAITYSGANLTIIPRALTVTADGVSKTYGDVNPALTYTATGLINNDTLSGSLTTTAGQYSNVGSYGITQGSLANANYAISYTGANLTVNPRALTVTANAQSRAYGDANPTLTYTATGLINNDTLSGSLATTAGQYSDVGSYGITQGSLANANYAISYTGANLTVNSRALTVMADAKSKAYGDANPTLTYTVGGAGLVNGDTFSGSLTTSAGQYSNVGAYAIAQGTLAASSNYALTYAGANLTVNPRALTVTADGVSKTYGDVNPALTYTATGLINNDTLSGSLATTAGQYSNVGSYGITQGSLANTNYAISYSGANLTITPRALTVTADGVLKTYGDANPVLTYAASGLVNGDTLSGSLSTTAGQYSNVGAYAITQGSLTNANYAISYAGANLTVNPRALTVTADALLRAYGDANPTLTYTATGLVNNDTLSGSLSTTAGQYSDVGNYAITGSFSASSNYALTYVGANLSINQRAITVTADAVSKIYGDTNPVLSYMVGGAGLVNGDALSGSLATTAGQYSNVGSYAITGSFSASSNYALTYVGANLSINQRAITVTADAQSKTYGDANPALSYRVGGAGLVNGDTLSGLLTTSAGQYSNVGVYAIAQGTLAASGNYALTYAGANLNVNQRALRVTADAQSKTYGDANPTLTYTATGLVNNDALSGSLSTTARQYSNVGAYAITQGSLANANYAISYTGADLTVNQRAITVAADSLSRRYGLANPALTYTIGGAGLVNGDRLSGGLATSATSLSAPGAYAITQGTLAASADYSMTFLPGVLTVKQATNPEPGTTASSVAMAFDMGRFAPLHPAPSDNTETADGTHVLLDDPRLDGTVICLDNSSCISVPAGTRH